MSSVDGEWFDELLAIIVCLQPGELIIVQFVRGDKINNL